jgi:hypothetical protein
MTVASVSATIAMVDRTRTDHWLVLNKYGIILFSREEVAGVRRW